MVFPDIVPDTPLPYFATLALDRALDDLSDTEILDYYADKVAKWQVPDKVIFVDAIPLSGTGKMLKKDLREQFGAVLLES